MPKIFRKCRVTIAGIEGLQLYLDLVEIEFG
jgi:hypothetical protein